MDLDTFVGNKAFTEDGILIFNVLAYSERTDITIDDIKQYFSDYGEIVNIRRISTISFYPFLYEVQYQNAESAASALKNINNRLKKSRIYVKSRPSFEQPDGKKIAAALNENNYSCTQNQSLIGNLNDDCLEHIMKYLTPSDQVNFALSCRRFAAILALMAKSEYTNFNSFDCEFLTPFQFLILIQIIGPQIKSFTVDMDFFRNDEGEKIIGYLAKYLKNIEKFKVFHDSSEDDTSILMEDMESLKELELVRCDFFDILFQKSERCANLKKLVINRNDFITGSSIATLNGLENLTLIDCPGIVECFEQICKNLTNLNYLKLDFKHFENFMETKHYKFIVKYLVQLKTLRITCDKGNFNCLANLPNLRTLEIKTTGFTSIEGFCTCLAKQQANQLEELSITTFSLTAKAAISLANLKRLKVLKCNFDETDDILEQFSNMKELEELHISSKHPLNRGVLKLLENCLKLKRIYFDCSSSERIELIMECTKLLQTQRKQGCRTHCVDFVFKRLSDMSLPLNLENYDVKDIIKVIDELKEDGDFESYSYDETSSDDNDTFNAFYCDYYEVDDYYDEYGY